jgi:hypothetical protein
MDNPFTTCNELRDLFGSHCGTRLADRLTYVPVGRVEFPSRVYGEGPYLSVRGSRSFPASDWADMLDWMQTYEREQTALDLL